jgi:hypothetical protein
VTMPSRGLRITMITVGRGADQSARLLDRI